MNPHHHKFEASVGSILTVAILSFGCSTQNNRTRVVQSWRFQASGPLVASAANHKDTLRLGEGTLQLVLSGRKARDTTFFAIRSGLRLSMPQSSAPLDLGPAEEFIISRRASRDSVYFAAGRLSFKGTGTDVFMGGTFELQVTDSNSRWTAINGRGTWSMALVSQDTMP